MLELREMHGYCTTRRSLCFAAIYAAMLLFGNAECAGRFLAPIPDSLRLYEQSHSVLASPCTVERAPIL